MAKKIGISFGTANVGVNEKWKTPILGNTRLLKGDEAKEILQYLAKNKINELDTAFIYGQGASEEEIGNLLPKKDNPWLTSTKAHPDDGFTKQGVQDQLNLSLKRLKLKSVDIFYLHFPSETVPLEETLEGVNILYKQGKFREFGLSNYLAFQIAQVFYISKARGWILPTVYQGPYSLVARKAEQEIFLALKMFGLRFYAYSPLGAGLLAKPLASFEKVPDDSRFASGSWFSTLYWKKGIFNFLQTLNTEAEKHKLSLRQVALSWLVHHSQLDIKRGDKIVIGASSLKQLQTSLDELWGAKELPQTIVDIIKASNQGLDADPTPQKVSPVSKL